MINLYLVDTNVWLERLLDQTRPDEVGRFLSHVPSEELFVTDFAFYSIAVVLHRLNRVDALQQFTNDAFVDGAVSLIHLDPENTFQVISIMNEYGLDFDDAYQYVASEKHGLTLVSFDSDFDKTVRGKKAPVEVLSR